MLPATDSHSRKSTCSKGRESRALPVADKTGLARTTDFEYGKSVAKALISRLHNTLRNQDSHSNIIERFDEIIKILFLKTYVEDQSGDILYQRPLETPSQHAERLRTAYAKAVAEKTPFLPSSFAKLNTTDSAIHGCANVIADQSFRNTPFDINGLAYEEVIRNTFDKSDNQQFFTPFTVIQFMVDIMRPTLRGNICDPASGTGGFLVEILRSGITYSSLTALEIDERLAWVTGMNLLAHGAESVDVRWLPKNGTLGHGAQTLFGKFDAIITNPPFASDLTDSAALQTFTLGKNRTSRRRGILFLERCHHLLKPGGSLGFIIDESVLNGSLTEDVRRYVTNNFDIDAIVSLPEQTFMPYASVNTSILFLRKREKAEKAFSTTFYAKAQHTGRKGNGNDDIIYDKTGIARLNSDFPELSRMYHQFRATGNHESTSNTYAANIHANLSQEPDGWRLDFRYHHPTRKHNQSRLISTSNKLLTLEKICDERNESIVPAQEMEGQVILYTGLAHIESTTGTAHQIPTPANSLKSAVKKYEPNDIVFAKMRPNLRKVAYMDTEEGGYTSSECMVLSAKIDDTGYPVVDPLLLSILLRSDLVYDQILHLIAGISRPRLSAHSLKTVLIPVPDRATQKVCRKKYLTQIRKAADLRSNANKVIDEADEIEIEAIQNLVQKFA